MDKVNIYSDKGELICAAKSAQIESRQIEDIEHGGWHRPASVEGWNITLDGISSRTVKGVQMCDEMVLDAAQLHRLAQVITGDVTDEREHVMSVVRSAVMGANMLSDAEKEYVMFRIDEAMKEI